MNQKQWHPAYGFGIIQGNRFIFDIPSTWPDAWLKDIEKYTALYPTMPVGVEKILYKTNSAPFPKYHGFFSTCSCCDCCTEPCTSLIKTNASGGFTSNNSLAVLQNIAKEWKGDWRFYQYDQDRDKFELIETTTPRDETNEKYEIGVLLADLEASKINYPDFSKASDGETVWSPIWGKGVITGTGIWVFSGETLVRVSNSKIKVKFEGLEYEEFFFPNGISGTIRGLYPVLFYTDYSTLYFGRERRN